MTQTTAETTGWKTFGHDAAVTLLNGSFVRNRVSHAYLFTGPNGVGKRTLALDLAKALNCSPAPNLMGEATRPCDNCSPCDRISRKQHPDVRVISPATPTSNDRDADAAQRRVMIGIDLIADIQNDAMLEPYEGGARVFIIAGAERMSPEAANSLLKILEEPPPSVHIFLTATSHRNLPETIISRCHRIQLRPVPTDVIETELIQRFELDPDRAARLAKLSMGAPGWAINAIQDTTIEEARSLAASRILNTINADLEERFRYAREMAGEFRRDRTSALEEVDRWVEICRDVAFAKHDLETSVIFDERLPEITELSKSLTEAQVSDAFSTIIRTRQALQANALPQLAFEVMMIDIPQVASRK